LDGLSLSIARWIDRALFRIGNGRVLDEHVEATELFANALRCGGDRGMIGHVELERDGVWPNLLGRDLAPMEIARSDQYSEAMSYEVLRDLKTDSLICPGN
jgi:hypothetical protein